MSTGSTNHAKEDFQSSIALLNLLESNDLETTINPL